MSRMPQTVININKQTVGTGFRRGAHDEFAGISAFDQATDGFRYLFFVTAFLRGLTFTLYLPMVLLLISIRITGQYVGFI